MPRLFIFLDIDGVLNNEATWRSRKWSKTKYKTDCVSVISEENLAVFEWLVEQLSKNYNLNVILSSTWRHSFGCTSLLKDLSIKHPVLKFHDYTGDYQAKRGMEIQEYMSNNGINYDEILILDDDRDMLHLSDRLYKTYGRDGLTFKDAECILESLIKA